MVRASGQSIGSELKGVREATPQRPAGSDSLSPRPPGLRGARPQVRGAAGGCPARPRGQTGQPPAARWRRSLLSPAHPVPPPRATRGRSRAAGPAPAHLGGARGHAPPGAGSGRGEPPSRPPGRGAPLTSAHGLGGLTRRGAPPPLPQPAARAAGRRGLHAAAAAAAAAASSASAAPLLPPRPPPPPVPPLRSRPPAPPLPCAPPSPKSGPRPAPPSPPGPGLHLPAGQPLPEPAPGHGPRRLPACAPGEARARGAGSAGPGAAGGGSWGAGTPRGALPARRSLYLRLEGRVARTVRPGCPRCTAPAGPEVWPRTGRGGEGGLVAAASRSRGARLAALPAWSAHPRRRDTAHTHRHTRRPPALRGELERLRGSPASRLRACECVRACNPPKPTGGIANPSVISVKSGGPSIRSTSPRTKRKNPSLFPSELKGVECSAGLATAPPGAPLVMTR